MSSDFQYQPVMAVDTALVDEEEQDVPDYGATRSEEASVVSDDASSENGLAGVRAIEAIAQTWTPWSLFFAYVGIGLLAITTSLESLTTTNLTIYATSSFHAHALVAAVTVVQGVILAVIKAPMAKISDVFGRLEAFICSVFIYVIGYIQQAAANNVQTYASAQIFYSAGSTGLQILVQIFIADTTNLRWRALFSSLVDIPFLFTVWIGPVIANAITTNLTWRWGYGIWAVILPVAFLPLASSLLVNQLKAARNGTLRASPLRDMTWKAVAKQLWYDLDFFGLLLFCAAVALMLLALVLGPENGWSSPSIVTMLLVGGLCLIVFPFWERSRRFAPKAFFPRDLLRQRTVACGVILAFFYYMAFYLSVQPYFLSYLLVVQNLNLTTAGHITQIFNFASSVTAVCLGVVIRYTGHYKYFITFGTCIYILGIGLMVMYRTQHASIGAIVGCQILVGVGGGMVNVPTQLGIQASASHQEVAAATAVFLIMLEIGGAVGSAISGAIWTTYVPRKLAQYLPADAKSEAAAIFGSITVASQRYPPGTPERDAIDRAYQETMTTLLTVAAFACIPLFPLSLMMKNYKLRNMDQKVQGLVIGGHEHTAGRSEDDARESSDALDGEPSTTRREPAWMKGRRPT